MDETQIRQLVDDEIKANFQKKIGDTPTDALQLTPKKYVTSYVTSVLGAYIPSGTGTTKGDILGYSAASVIGRLAVGADGTVLTADSTKTSGLTWVSGNINLFGDGADGNFTTSGNLSLSRDMYYNNLTITGGDVLTTAGYQIYVKGTLTINNIGAISYKGVDGSNGGNGSGGTGGTGGAGGAALSSGTLAGGKIGTNGTAGAGGTTNANGISVVATNDGVNASPSIGTSGVTSSFHGGAGGVANARPGGTGGASGAGGVATTALNLPDSPIGAFIHADLTSTFTQHVGSASACGSGGGGGGAGDGGNGGAGGGAGGSGSTGGIVAVYANIIINNSVFGITANGGAGGNGGNGEAGSGTNGGGGGGGQGGNGGTGGVIIVVYHTLTQNGAFTVGGGTLGTGGTGGSFVGNAGIGTSGQSGSVGATGKIWQYQI